MDIFDYWFDGDGNIHKISDMDDNYIQNCIRQLEKMNDGWWDIDVSDLSRNELKDKDKVGSKAWFVLFGKKYLEVLKFELDCR